MPCVIILQQSRVTCLLSADYPPSLATRSVRRDTFRLAAFRCTTPFWAERMMTGSASFKAANARLRSPEARASSTLTMIVRMRERRGLLTLVRRAMTRAALRAELVLAISVLVLGVVGVPLLFLVDAGKERTRRRYAKNSGGAFLRRLAALIM